MSTSEVFCFIPAKAASTRLPKKNLLPLNGKELIYYPIRNAIDSGLFSDVVVSSESEEILEVASGYGASVPYRREEKLSRDPYGVADVLVDFLTRFPAYASWSYCCILLPTAPLTTLQDIQGAFRSVREGEWKSLMSVSPTAPNAFRSVCIKAGRIEPLFPDSLPKRSQELPETYRINGAIVIVEVEAFLEERSYFLHPIGAYTMPPERAVDIDTQWDYDLARFLAEKGAGG